MQMSDGGLFMQERGKDSILKSKEQDPDTISRRKFLEASSATLASAAIPAIGAEGQAAGNVQQAEHDKSGSDPGPENKLLVIENVDSNTPPPTDHGDVPAFWYSFSLAHKRVEEGGWARQVNVKDLPISKEIAGVNMRLTAGGVRELHWHAAAEWSLMLYGNARLTAIDDQGRSYVNDVTAGDLWYFPVGIPHSIQGLGPDGCEFLLVFDDGNFSEFNTTLISDWLAHIPKSVLAKNWGVPESALKDLPKEELYIYQGDLPGSLEEDRKAAAGHNGPSPISFDFKMHSMRPTKTTHGGEVRIVDSKVFPISITVAMAHVVLKPGGLRELHWHPNADEWQYYIKGKGRMTLFINGAKGRTMDFQTNDVGYVPKTMGHYIENTGDTDLIFLEMFKANSYQDLSLSEWMAHTPPELVMQHLHISRETLASIPKIKPVIVPA